MTAKLPGQDGTAPDAGTAAREQHAPEIARRSGGACGGLRRREFQGWVTLFEAIRTLVSLEKTAGVGGGRRPTDDAAATRSDAKLKETRIKLSSLLF